MKVFIFLAENDNVQCLAETFTVKTPNKKTIFSTNDKKVSINAECLKITGDEGCVFKHSVQASGINGLDDYDDLK